MSSKEKILQILESKKGITISGEDLAGSLKISRTAVWKAINELRKEGHCILAVTNKGYCLSSENDVISIQGIQHYLAALDSSDKIHLYKTLDSTNQTAKRMALDGAAPGTVVIAEEQLKGRGRMGRSFFSPADTGIYMSMILKPGFDVSKAVLITTAAAVAVCLSIEKIAGVKCSIKWVNDIYIGDKKVCGILTEAVTDFESGHVENIILGIGINVSTSEKTFPSELSRIAGSLIDSADPDIDPLQSNTISKGFTRNQLIAEIINQITKINGVLESRDFIKEYKARSNVLGQEINVLKGGTLEDGKVPDLAPVATAVDIDHDGGLVIQYKDGTIETLNSGEISIRIKKES